MAAEPFIDLLNAQIGHELAAHNQYLACAVHYDALTMPRMASVAAAEVRALAGSFAFNGRFLPRTQRGKTGIAAQRRAARKRRNQLREKRRG